MILQIFFPRKVAIFANVVTVLSAESLKRSKSSLLLKNIFYQYTTVIDNLGCSSGKAQFLNGPVTTFAKLLGTPDQRIYVLKTLPRPQGDPSITGSENIIGMLKVGPKKLFLQDRNDRIVQIAPLCVLDFYIDECYQRQGILAANDYRTWKTPL